MDSMIKEINDNLKAIIDTIKENKDSSINTLDNIQIQMDKKVEEAKKYKIQVDSSKEKIKELEEENKSLELSLSELSDKFGKMNLVSVVEAGNREIKTKINDNLKQITREKEHIADLTNKARTIKDLLINLKKDKTLKEARLENIKVIYDYYNDNINDIIDYAFNHSENLADYKNRFNNVSFEEEEEIQDIQPIDLENTMVFDEIANIDDNKNFKDEMTFISNQIDDTLENDELSKIDEIVKNSLNKYEIEEDEEDIKEPLDTTQVFNAIMDDSFIEESEEQDVDKSTDVEEDFSSFEIDEEEIDDVVAVAEDDNTSEIDKVSNIGEDFNPFEITEEDLKADEIDEATLEEESTSIIEEDSEVKEEVSPFIVKEEIVDNEVVEEIKDDNQFNFELDTNIKEVSDNNLKIDDEKKVVNDSIPELNINKDLFNLNKVEEVESISDKDEELDEENEIRINKINDLFANFENNTVALDKIEDKEKGIEEQIDNAYLDIFGKPLNSDDLNVKTPTLTDIFGNPIQNDEASNDTKVSKKLEELFVENGIDFNKFREDEKNYLKQIYDEEKFSKILEVLKKNKINLDNLYYSFNIFGEITSEELETLISKLLSTGQSVESIGLVLEKLPKVKKYNLDEAITSYGDYIKNIDITELIMKAKELYKNGGNL